MTLYGLGSVAPTCTYLAGCALARVDVKRGVWWGANTWGFGT